MNRKKIVVIGVLCCFLCLGTILLWKIWSVHKNEKNAITKFEWMKMLCTEMNMKPKANQQDFSGYMQLAKTNKIVDQSETLDDDAVSGEFLACTAVRAMGLPLFKGEMEKNNSSFSKPTEKDCIKVLVSKKKIQQSELNQYISPKRAKILLRKFMEFYKDSLLNHAEPVNKILYKKNVYEISAESVNYTTGDSQISVTKDWAEKLQAGDVIVMPVTDGKQKLAKKVTSVNKSDNTVSVEKTKLEEIVDNAFISATLSPQIEEIAAYNGCRLDEEETQNKDDSKYEIEVYAKKTYYSNNFDFLITVKKGNKKFTMGSENGEYSDMPIQQEYDVKYELEDINIPITISVSDGIPDYIAAGMNIKQKVSGKIDGNFNIRKKLFDIPLYEGAVAAKVSLYLVSDSDGLLSLQTDYSTGAIVSYQKGLGSRCMNLQSKSEKSLMDVDCNAKVNLEADTFVSVFEDELNSYRRWEDEDLLLDMNMQMGIETNKKVVVRENGDCCVDIQGVCPVFKMDAFAADSNKTRSDVLASGGKDICVTCDFSKFNSPSSGACKEKEHLENGIKVEKCTYINQPIAENNDEAILKKYKDFLSKNKVDGFMFSGASREVFNTPFGPILRIDQGTASCGRDSTFYKIIDGKVTEFHNESEGQLLFYSNKILVIHQPNYQNYSDEGNPDSISLYEMKENKMNKIDELIIKKNYEERMENGISEEEQNQAIDELLQKYKLERSKFKKTVQLQHLYCLETNEIEITKVYEHGCKEKLEKVE